MSDIIMPNGQLANEYVKALKIQGDVIPEGAGTIVGFSPWRNISFGLAGKGSSPKKVRWNDYYDMYTKHAIVRAAIDTLAGAAANTTYDFVPVDSRSKPRKNEVDKLKKFFSNQHNFPGEMRKIYIDLLVYGDAYLYIVPDRQRNPVRLKRLHPKTITVKATRNGEIQNYFQRNPEDPTDELVTYGPLELIHFKIDDPNNDLYGLSPLESLKNAVATDLYAQRFNASFFMNSAVTGTVITVKTSDPNEMERNRKFLTENYTGPSSAHKPLILQGDAIDVKKMVESHLEMGFIEGRKQIMTEILAVLKVPPTKIGITESANRSNSKEQDKSFRSESVDPLQRLVENVINDQLVKIIMGIQNTKIAHSDTDLRDATDQMGINVEAIKGGVKSFNEVRSELGLPAVEGGDIVGIMTPTGFVPLSMLPIYAIIPAVQTGQLDQDHPGGGAAATALAASDKSPKTKEPQDIKAPIPKTTTTKKAVEAFYESVEAVKKARYDDDESIIDAYASLHDLTEELQDARIDQAYVALNKACHTNDELLRKSYLNRADRAMKALLSATTVMENENE